MTTPHFSHIQGDHCHLGGILWEFYGFLTGDKEGVKQSPHFYATALPHLHEFCPIITKIIVRQWATETAILMRGLFNSGFGYRWGYV